MSSTISCTRLEMGLAAVPSFKPNPSITLTAFPSESRAKKEEKRIAARKRARDWATANPDKVRSNMARWRANNPDRIALSRKKEHEKRARQRRARGIPSRTVFANDEQRRIAKLAARKRWERKNSERIKAIRNRWRIKHRERIAAQTKLRNSKNPEEYKARVRRAYERNRQNLTWVISSRMRCRMWMTLRNSKARRSWESLVGYSREDLIAHLESLFSEGMTWAKVFQGEIEIDHKKPIASFVYSSPQDEQFQQCWALSNLRPLWKWDNRVSGGSV
jgi:hypothetical protein